MKTTEQNTGTTEDTLATIDSIALDDITGGCGACGQTSANGAPPVAAAGANKAGLLGAAFSAFYRR